MRALLIKNSGRRASRFGSRLLMLGMACLLMLVSLDAVAGIDQKFPEVKGYFPAATRFDDITGKPPAAAVYNGDKVIGYVFESVMVAPVPAYSGDPVNILVAIDQNGKILGTKVLQQNEPILLVGIPVQRLYDFVARYIGHNVKDQIVVGGSSAPGSIKIDAISSATVTSMVVNETIMNAALEVAVSRNLVSGRKPTASAPATIKTDYFKPSDWTQLTGNGAFRRLHLDRGMVADAFKGQPESGLIDDPTAPVAGREKDEFIDLYYADITPPTVGRNLLGASGYATMMQGLKPGDEAVAVVANGLYSFKGVGYVRGGVFDRLHVMQAGKLFLFKDSDFVVLDQPDLAGMPSFNEKGIFILRHGQGFNPGAPWTLQLLVNRQVGPLKSIYNTFSGSYQIPADYVTQPTVSPIPDDAPLWVKIWYAKRFQIAVLVAGLFFLSLILVFQDWVVKRPKLLERVRVGFLIYTVVFIGWYGLAQLSVVNILTFVNSVMHGFHWTTFLMDPLIFILWTFVAVSLLLVGRGVYCGWLCPFGAMQVLINKLAVKFKVPQLEPPSYVHERLWAIKYVILLFLFGLSLQSVGLAERFAEIEPFKTAVTLHFMRSWGYVLFAVGLLAAAAFTNKIYCRYVCPLGAGLAVSGRWRLFEWLRRRKECGHPCQVCAVECEVRAISPLGPINYNECHYCLDCQVTYNNDRKCPPLVERRKKREKREGASRPLPTPVFVVGAEDADTPAEVHE
ncbi:4Fe-4S binding protein [Rhodanobacter sp. AS-Z3]|uniref:NosR/NirI family protein n=1 Tax=Rhodanobacter sp. AS-Z3 TaxID=3031330 RepID=UPI002478AD58|nr:NosR/NirI family protein [Rhodanobacter sp. AS-Z3]WEN14524.1 4Fe-4S binding protein [Rhodanobacter sp. AS-Z3]